MAEERPFAVEDLKFVYSKPAMAHVRCQRDLIYAQDDVGTLGLNVYLPPNLQTGEKRPGVIFIHGGPVPAGLFDSLKDSVQYEGWGRLTAVSELIAITFNHRYNHPNQFESSVEQIVQAVDYVRAHAKSFQLDPDRLCLWVCSGGGPHISWFLAERPSFLRCLVIYYAILNPHPIPFLAETLSESQLNRFDPRTYLDANNPLPFPIFLARAGLDDPVLNETNDDFIRRALAANLSIDVVNHPNGRHAFDVLDDNGRSRQIIAQTIKFIQENVTS